MPPGLHLYVAEDLDQLAGVAAEILVVRDGAVLEPDCVVVPSAPVRQWLDWRLSERLGTSHGQRTDGVVANVVNYFPDEFVRLVEGEACRAAGHSPTSWDLDSLTVRVLATQSPRPSITRARSIAEDIDDLVRWRPDVVRGDTSPVRGAEEALRVYRTLAHPDDLPLAQKDLASETLVRASVSTLPTRTLVFGLASVPGGPTFATLMRDLSTHSDVHVLLTSVDAERIERAVLGSADATDGRALATWARESDEAVATWVRVAPRADQWSVRRMTPRAETALDGLSRALRAGNSDRLVADDTLVVIGASGLDRQIEQLRDVVLTTMRDGAIDARDVLVASTDPAAVMDAVERHWLTPVDGRGVPRLPADPTSVAASDTRLRLDASLALLNLVRSRCTASDVLDFIQFPAVATTLGVDRAARDRLDALARDAHLTFGVSPQQRDAFDVYHPHGGLREDAGTWQRLVDRVVAASVVGVAGSDVALGVPDDLDLVARVDALLRVVDLVATRRGQELPLREWLSQLDEWMTTVAGDPRVYDDSFSAAIERARHTVPVDDVGPTLSIDDFADLWSLFARSSSRQRVFGRSGVTVTDVASLAYAPHRLVCLVGLDDHRLPTGSWPSAVMGERRVGDPDPRYAALAAVRAACATAREKVILTFTDRRLDDGRTLDPPIALDELMDVISSVTGESRDAFVRTSPRHAFSVPGGRAGMIATTLDPRAAGLTTPASAPAPLLVEDARTIDVANVRSFLAGPVSYYLRRTLRADIPDDEPNDTAVPPLTLDDRHRAFLQRQYVWALATAIRERHAFGSLPAMPTPDHGADAPCDDECAWFHVVSHALQAEITDGERHNANVPPRLWRHRMRFGQLDLAAYNLVVDLGAATRWDVDRRSALFGAIAMSDDTLLRCSSLRATVESPLIVEDDDVLATVTWEPRGGRPGDWRHVLRTALDVVVLSALAPERTVLARTYFLPNRVERYSRNNASKHVVAGHLPGNPRMTLRFNGDPDDARTTLAAFVDLFRRGCRNPLPLFPETSVAAVATALRRSVPDAWSNYSGYGESQRLAHQLLFPYSVRDLLTLDDGRLPLHDELTAIFGQFSVENLSQAQRGHEGRGDGPLDEPTLFSPLVGAP